MEIWVCRERLFRQCWHGRLSIDGERSCDTLENVEGCLPPGKYYVRMESEKKEDGVMDYTILRILSADAPLAKFSTVNGIYGLERGSIAVGEWVYLGFILHTQPAWTLLVDRVRHAVKRGQGVTLVIEEAHRTEE